MSYTTRYAHALSLVLPIVSCADPGSTSAPFRYHDSAEPLAVQIGPPSTPNWITDPEEFPAGLIGTNNCAFPIGRAGYAQWNYHEDAACWERPGPDGWTRQHMHNVHIFADSHCGGQPGDAFAIRVAAMVAQDSRLPVLTDRSLDR